MSLQTVEDRVRKIVADHLGKDLDDVKPEASLMDDLGADSLDGVELLTTLEEEFDTHIEDDDAEQVITVADLIAAVKAKVA